MKLMIDKHGGTHYHKPDCEIPNAKPIKGSFRSNYEEIEHQVRSKWLGIPYEYGRIKIDGKWYQPCPFCFGHSRK